MGSAGRSIPRAQFRDRFPVYCMIALFDSFNRRTISRHRTLEAAVLAHRKHARAVRRANGPGAYIPVDFVDTTTENRVDPTEARIQADRIAYF